MKLQEAVAAAVAAGAVAVAKPMGDAEPLWQWNADRPQEQEGWGLYRGHYGMHLYHDQGGSKVLVYHLRTKDQP